MKKIFLFINILLINLFLFQINSIASTEFLNADDYITVSENQDASVQVSNFLNICLETNKDALFGNRVYLFNNGISLLDEVSIYGSSGTVFKGNNPKEQINFNGNVKNIEIKNIVFDNITLYLGDSTSENIIIENNIFINANKVDISIDSGLSSVYEGYYILLTHVRNSKIKSNIFLRDNASLGRGIGVYKTSNIEILDNYFGILEDVETSIVSDATKSLLTRILDMEKDNKIALSDSDQGNFMTAINVINSDSNVLIQGNHVSLNTDLVEFYYQSNPTSTNFYHRDHFIYAKLYNNLEIVGNYFKGMNKNQDGGVKCRDGEGLLIHKNVFDDVLLLLYVQNNNSYFKKTDVSNNIFINRSYTNEVLSYATLTNSYNKYLTVDFLILFYNYYSNAVIEDFTIENNNIISTGMNNDCITINAASSAANTINNLSIENNTNLLNDEIDTKIIKTSHTSTVKYLADKTKYDFIDVEDLYLYEKINYKISNKKLVVDDNIEVYYENELFVDTTLELGSSYEFIFLDEINTNIKVDNPKSNNTFIDKTLVLKQYAKEKINLNYDIDPITLGIYNSIELSSIIENFQIYDEIKINSNIVKLEDDKLVAIAGGSETITVILGGFELNISVTVTGIPKDASISLDKTKYELILEDKEYIYEINCNPEYLKADLLVKVSNNNLEAEIKGGKLYINPISVGSSEVEIYLSKDENIKCSLNFNIYIPTTDINVDTDSIKIYMYESYLLKFSVLPNNTTDLLELTSSDPNVVTIESNGLISSKSIGTAIIKIKSGSIVKEINIEVIKPDEYISLDKYEYSLVLSNVEHTYKISTKPSQIADNLKINIDNSNIIEAKIENGNLVVITKGVGQSVVTIYYQDNEEIKCNINFTVINPASDINLKKYEIDLIIDQSYLIEATVVPLTSTDSLEFTSLDTNIVQVDSIGNVIAKGNGSTKIIIKAGSISKELIVNVLIPATDIKVVNEMELKLGESEKLIISTVPEIVTDEVSITVLDANILSISKEWIVNALSIGSTNIIVKCGNVTKIIKVIVKSNIESISIEKNIYTLNIEESKKSYELIINPNTDNPNLGIRTDKNGIVHCNINGNSLEVIPLKEGTVVITVYDIDNPNVFCNVIFMVEVNETVESGCGGSLVSSIIGLITLTCAIIVIKYKRKRIY